MSGSTPGRDRTFDADLRRVSLYPLSYRGIVAILDDNTNHDNITLGILSNWLVCYHIDGDTVGLAGLEPATSEL